MVDIELRMIIYSTLFEMFDKQIIPPVMKCRVFNMNQKKKKKKENTRACSGKQSIHLVPTPAKNT